MQGCTSSTPLPDPTVTHVATATIEPTSTATPDPHIGGSDLNCSTARCHDDVAQKLAESPRVINTPVGGHPLLLTGFCNGPACHVQATQAADPLSPEQFHSLNHENISCLGCHSQQDTELQLVDGTWVPVESTSTTTNMLTPNLKCSICHDSSGQLEPNKLHQVPKQ